VFRGLKWYTGFGHAVATPEIAFFSQGQTKVGVLTATQIDQWVAGVEEGRVSGGVVVGRLEGVGQAACPVFN